MLPQPDIGCASKALDWKSTARAALERKGIRIIHAIDVSNCSETEFRVGVRVGEVEAKVSATLQHGVATRLSK